MKMTPHTGETRNGLPLCELRLGDKIVAKIYPNEDGSVLRIMLPEFISFAQLKTLDIDQYHMIEFIRKVPHE